MAVVVNNTTKDLRNLRTRMCMVFQNFNLYPHLSILENCTLAPKWVSKIPEQEANEIAMGAFRAGQDRRPGHKIPEPVVRRANKQRVAIARALTMRPGGYFVR